MAATFDVIYRDGSFHPMTPMDLPEGTAASVIVQAPLPPVLNPSGVLARILASAAKFDPATDHPEVTSQSADEILYCGSGGAR